MHFKNRMLRRIVRPKGKVTGSWWELQKEEHQNWYFVPFIMIMMKTRMIRWAGNAARVARKRNAHRISVGKTEGKKG
jgi:hypothetical protein